MCKTPPAVSLVEGAEEEQVTHCNGSCKLPEKNGKVLREEKRRVDPLLDRDWGSAIPDYIYSGCVCALVFIMGITIRGRVNTQVLTSCVIGLISAAKQVVLITRNMS
jgi:phage-related protein